MINITIKRYQNLNNDKKTYDEEFRVDAKKVTTLLSALYKIHSTKDSTLCFDSGCRSGVCGSCSVMVNGKEELSCGYMVQDGDRVEPLRYHEVQRDLKVSKNKPHSNLAPILKTVNLPDNAELLKDDVDCARQSDCILCDICYSACPVLAVNPDFAGPFALTRAYRYALSLLDDRAIIDSVQKNAIWDCTLCGECTAVCPQNIDSKNDILMLRSHSAKHGYDDPSFSDMSFGAMDFGGSSFGSNDFGF